jgi:anti-sigma regulatory factor (Ser/Thr protein kinase)
MPTIEELHQEQSRAIFRSHIRKIVEIYDLEWRLLHELIQNAVDATQANSRVERGEVKVVLNLDNDTVCVRDNGTGFKHDLTLLVPGGTGEEKQLASRSPAKGYQGVGLKAVMYSTEEFEIESQTENEQWVFMSERLSQYISDSSSAAPDYLDEVRGEGSSDTYTEIKARFSPGTVKEVLAGLNRFLGVDAVKWKALYSKQVTERGRTPYEEYLTHFISWYFRTQSYVGCVNALLNVPVKDPETGEWINLKPVSIKVVLESSKQFDALEGEVGEWLRGLKQTTFSVEIPYRSWSYLEVATQNQALEQKYRIAPTIVTTKPNDELWETLKPTFRNKFLDIKIVPNEQATELRERYADFIPLLERKRSKVKLEDFEDVLRSVTGIYLAVGRTAYFELLGLENHGLRFISSNGTPTAHELSVSSTSSTWYLETLHLIINLDATLNVGKRHLVNSRLVGRTKQFFEACYPSLVEISKLFVERDISGPGTDPLPEVYDLKTLSRQNIPFRRFPADESTLVGLFGAAMTALDPTFNIYGFFSRARYDGKFQWPGQEVRSDAELKSLEFKVRLEVLIEEFDSATHDKEFRDLELIIVWDRRTDTTQWNVKGISAQRRTQLEGIGVPTDLIEYILEDAYGNYCPLICVADLLSRIPVVDKDDLDDFIKEMG